MMTTVVFATLYRVVMIRRNKPVLVHDMGSNNMLAKLTARSRKQKETRQSIPVAITAFSARDSARTSYQFDKR